MSLIQQKPTYHNGELAFCIGRSLFLGTIFLLFSSLLLLDIPEFTDRFAILEGLGKICALGTLILDF